MHIWNASPGALELTCGALRPSVFEPLLYLRDGNGTHSLTGTKQNGTYLFQIPAATVQDMLGGNAYLFLITQQSPKPQTPDLRWGWRYRLSQGQQQLSATDQDGASLSLDPDGFFNSPLEKYDEVVELSRETIVLK